ncbi:MAG: Gfo/Idh/MocA family protein [Limnochordia bacterium]|jgi:predicted dehydrogenase
MLNVGVVGLRRGMSFVNMFGRHPECKLAAVCDTQPGLAERVARERDIPAAYLDFDKFIDHDLDIVVVAAPPMFHVSQSIAALKRGRHVLSEVPAVANIEECHALVQAVKESSGKYMMGANPNFWAFIESWREMVRQGRLGKVIYAEAEYIHDIPSLRRTSDGQPTWRAYLAPIHYCTHSLGPILSLSDDRCVSAVGMHTGSNIDTEFGTVDMEVGLFKTEKGSVIKVLCGFSVKRPGFHYYSVYGTKGCLEKRRDSDRTIAYFEDIPNLQGMVDIPINTVHPHLPGWAGSGGHGTAEYVMVQAFLEAVLEDKEPPIDVYTALDYSVPGLCAHLSAEQGGKLMEVPNFRD